MQSGLLLQTTDADRLGSTCGDQPSWICETLLDWTDNRGLARVSEWLVARPLTILVVVLVAWVANRLIRRAIRRFADRIASPESHERISRLKRRTPMGVIETGAYSLRSAARAQTVAFVLSSIASVAIWTIATITVLGELGINLGPLIAGAGIAGIALGFGAQSLVRDFLSGIFMIVEDQYGVGDVIDVGDASGVVEGVSLRTTRVRDVNGVVWHIPNGTITRVGNMSQQWARALVDVSVSYEADLQRAEQLILDTARELGRDERFGQVIIEEPELWGVEQFGPERINLRVVMKTLPNQQYDVVRELRRRLKLAFDEHGIDVPAPKREIWMRREPRPPSPG